MKKVLVMVILIASAIGVTLVSVPIAALNLGPQVGQNGPPVKASNTGNQATNPGTSSDSPDSSHTEPTGQSQTQPSDNHNQGQTQNPNVESPPVNSGNSHMVIDPLNIMVLVNKSHNLSPGYVPPDLTQPRILWSFSEDLPKKLMRAEAANALTRLFEKASAEGITLLGVSGYRSYQTQKSIFDNRASQVGVEKANRTSARPGQSEHQTGLAMDITSPSVNGLVTGFGSTPEGMWVTKNAAEFGFIIRYQNGKEHITGYDYEPWHLRYVGVEAARVISKANITFEEYLGKSS